MPVKLIIVAALALGAALVPAPGLDRLDARFCLVIFAAAAGLWVTELIPAFATAILVIVMSVYVLGHPSIAADGGPAAWQAYLNPLASPVLVLFFGGFTMALAAAKHGFDVRMARLLIMPWGRSPRAVLLGVILTTALFSMFMSNTATSAMMIAILGPVLHRGGIDEGLRKRLVLAIPFAANIGGMGTIIGSPPNAVAASVLAQMGRPITFFGWMLLAGPVVLVLLLALWIILTWMFKSQTRELALTFSERPTNDASSGTVPFVIVTGTFTVTILGWLTEPLHGMPAPLVAMLPVAVFTGCGILTRDDLRYIDWDILLLVAGGLTLGVAMTKTGLSQTLVDLAPFDALPMVALLAFLAAFTVVLSNFMSNTATANMLIPIAIAVGNVSPRLGAIVVALSASLAMSLPISTPPNAIAFASRFVSTRDLLRYGTLMTLLGVPLTLAWLMTIHERLG
jgi:sodium-dependent dicarboxylate transporter 2/3/5